MELGESGALRAYRSSLADVAPLDRESERRLARAWRAGDKRAGEKLVTACLPFVIAIANQYRRWGVPLEDIIQQGNLGLLRAASKFDLGKDCRLATYAAYWIRAEIREYVIRGYRVVRLGTTKGERRALRAYRKTHEDDVQALAAMSGMDPAKVERLLPLLMAREASLDVRTEEHGALLDRMAATSPNPEDEASLHERQTRARGAVNEALLDLTERERLIVEERIMAEEPRTLQELGDQLGVSKERVRQIEERVCTKLRARLEEMRDQAA